MLRLERLLELPGPQRLHLHEADADQLRDIPQKDVSDSGFVGEELQKLVPAESDDLAGLLHSGRQGETVRLDECGPYCGSIKLLSSMAR